jgi:hypothetical protein
VVHHRIEFGSNEEKQNEYDVSRSMDTDGRRKEQRQSFKVLNTGPAIRCPPDSRYIEPQLLDQSNRDLRGVMAAAEYTNNAESIPDHKARCSRLEGSWAYADEVIVSGF